MAYNKKKKSYGVDTGQSVTDIDIGEYFFYF